MNGRRLPAGIVALGVILLLNLSGSAMFKGGLVQVPAERLIENVGKFIEENPKAPQGYYVLGRLHAMAFSSGEKALSVVAPRPAPGGKPGLPGFHPTQTVRVASFPATKLEDGRKRHLLESIRNYAKAAQLGPDQPIHFLGLAWMLEMAGTWAEFLDAPPAMGAGSRQVDPERAAECRLLVQRLSSEEYEDREEATRRLREAVPAAVPAVLEARNDEDPEVRVRAVRILSAWWSDEALGAYRSALTLSLEADRKQESMSAIGDACISLEAGKGILRMFGRRDLSKEEEAERRTVEKAVEEMSEKPRWITPLVIPLGGEQSLSEITDRRRVVSFDLDGDGEVGLWPWIRPSAAILVWDPSGEGRIESGLQLFGSVTWWFFWRDGFEPLSLLDDDGDGRLAGAELAGLALWRDRNVNGRSDAGEVLPLGRWGIESLAVKAVGWHAGCPCNPRGVRMLDGSALPLFDWTPERAGPAVPRTRD